MWKFEWTDAISVENIQIYRLSYIPKELLLYFIYTAETLLKLYIHNQMYYWKINHRYTVKVSVEKNGYALFYWYMIHPSLSHAKLLL